MRVRFINDGGVLHDLTFHDGTVLTAEPHAIATGTVTIPASGLDFHLLRPGTRRRGHDGQRGDRGRGGRRSRRTR